MIDHNEKNWTDAEIRTDPIGYQIEYLLLLDEYRTLLRQVIDKLREKRNKLARKRRK